LPVSFDELYTKQKKIIRHRSGPLLVLAGPGTGKTEVLTHRMAYLVNNRNVRPEEILGITFSRKAASEMTERLKEFKGFEKNQPRTSTLHAEALRILSGIGSNNIFLLDDDETWLLMMDAAEDLGLNLRARELRKLERAIGLLKANNKLPDEIPCIDEQNRTLKNLYERYEALLSFNRAIDLDGLIVKVVRVLSSSGLSYDPKIKHVLVDEYQDINQAEFEFIKILAKNVDSLFVVGDDDQSIYSWRGADPNIIRRFQKDFSGAQVEMLEESHRCTEHILKGAQAIVSRDPNYQHKPLHSVKGEGAPIHILVSKSWTAEAIWIANWIRDNLSKDLYKPGNIVILCKTLKLADFLIEQLRIVGIDFVFWRSGSFLDRDVVRNILAHIRLIVDKEDNLALRRCMHTATGQGVGKTGISKIRRIAEKHSCSLWEVLINSDKFIEIQRWRRHIKRFTAKIQELENKSSKLKLNETIDLIAKEIGASKKDSVDKLKDFAASLATDTSLKDFLAEVNRNRGLDLAGGVPEPEEEKDAVTIMSMHSAKGLTYDVVFLLGMEQGIFPDPSQNINEQRRLCYVAMTRARKELFLCYSKALKGPLARGLDFYNPSSFLYEIPKKHREVIPNY
jgi:DNA helicase-2/ATP-dependent DNA helicase PcrA